MKAFIVDGYGSADRRKWSKDIVSSYTILRRRPPDVGFKPLITNGIELNTRVVTGVCNNQWAQARNLFILKVIMPAHGWIFSCLSSIPVNCSIRRARVSAFFAV